MKIGLSLLGISRGLGGNFQYALDVFDALASRAAEHEIVAFYDNEALRAEPGLAAAGVKWVKVNRPAGAGGKALSLLRTAHALGLRFLRPVALGEYRALDAAGCDVILHPFWGSAAYLCATPAIVSIHDCAPKESPEWMSFSLRLKLNTLIQAIVRSARFLLVDSEHGAKLVRKFYGADPERVRVLPFRPPAYLRHPRTPDLDVRAKYGLSEPYFFLPGRWGSYKNTERVLAALRRFNAGGTARDLVLVGIREGEMAEARAEVARLGLQDRVRILGFVPDDDMAALYKNALAMVFPTLLGPTSIPVYEALATGCPAIVPSISGYPGLVGDAALVVDPVDVDAIAAAMRRLSDSESLRADLTRRGFARIEALNQVDYAGALFDLCARASRGRKG
jgi:glycosyltransferase involved in cell wall biosynthesis